MEFLSENITKLIEWPATLIAGLALSIIMSLITYIWPTTDTNKKIEQKKIHRRRILSVILNVPITLLAMMYTDLVKLDTFSDIWNISNFILEYLIIYGISVLAYFLKGKEIIEWLLNRYLKKSN